MRKAQLSIQFNWIFLLIVGAVIFIFFFLLISNQQKSSASSQATDLAQGINTVLTTLSNEPNALQEYHIPDANIRFVCEPGLNEYYVLESNPIDITYEPIFTPKLLEGDAITTWTSVWQVPFDAATFTYMADERTLFIFVNSTSSPETDSYLTQLYNRLPKGFAKTHLANTGMVPAYRPKGYDHYIYITSSNRVDELRSQDLMKGSVIKGLQFDSGGINTYGTVVFSAPGKPAEQSSFLLESSLWGALFSEDKEFYECTMNKAINRFLIGAEVLSDRAQSLASELSFTPCEYQLVRTHTLLDDMINEASEHTIGEISSQLYAQQSELKQLASDSLRGNACPYLY